MKAGRQAKVTVHMFCIVVLPDDLMRMGCKQAIDKYHKTLKDLFPNVEIVDINNTLGIFIVRATKQDEKKLKQHFVKRVFDWNDHVTASLPKPPDKNPPKPRPLAVTTDLGLNPSSEEPAFE